MKDWKKSLIPSGSQIRQAIETIEKSLAKIALVVDSENRLLGTVTDGDIRRGILRGTTIDSPVELVMNSAPRVAARLDPKKKLLAQMRENSFHQMPIVDGDGRVIGMEILEELLSPTSKENWVVLMAGGLGSRLGSLTEDRPKSLLPVGPKPLLETIIRTLKDYGFCRYYLAVNYKAEMIEEHFGDGAAFDVDIRYLKEPHRMGTVGALSLLPERTLNPILVMNADVLTNVNFQQLLDFHQARKAKATMCVREYNFQVPYGVVKLHGDAIAGIDEKPVHKFFVNAGIYVLEPELLSLIPKDSLFDMPSLFEKAIGQGIVTSAFPVREYWKDVGRVSDLESANDDFLKEFK